MRKLVAAAGCGVAVVLAAGAQEVVRVAVDASDVKAEVPRTLYGTGMEDVNHEICGGLDAQRLYDESFEEQEIAPTAGNGAAPMPMWVCGRQWEEVITGGGSIRADRNIRHLGAVSVCLRPNGGSAAVANAGLNGWGVPCRAGKALQGHFFARGSAGRLEVALQRRDGSVTYARRTVDFAPTNGWRKLTFSLTPSATDPAARFAIVASGEGQVWIDDAYLADEPTNEFGRMGCREDVVEAFRRQGLTFLRWGGSMANSWGYVWKNMQGDRRPYDGFWFRTSSTGFLYREFVEMASRMKLPCAFSIYAYEPVETTAKIAEWLKAYDGDIYVQVGNEECQGCTPTCGECTLGDCRRYCESLRLIVSTMRKVNPRIKFVSALMFRSDRPDVMDEGFRLTDGYVDFWDIHLQVWGEDVMAVAQRARDEFAAFRDTIRRNNPRSKMRAAVFEENCDDHGMRRALVHAAVLGVVREQGDFVLTSCPANALQPYGQNDNGWDQGQIFLTPDKTWLQPCGWAQQMASASHRDLLVAGASDDRNVQVSATRDREGRSLVVHLVNAATAPKALAFDFAKDAGWRLKRATALWASGPRADNPPEDPDRISPKDVTADFRAKAELRPYSYTTIEFVKQD